MANEFIARKGFISLENVKSKQYRYYEYDPLLTYNTGDGIQRNNEELYCMEDSVTGTFDLSKWQIKGSEKNFEIKNSNCISLDGRFMYIDSGQKFQTTFQNDFSIEFYVKLDDGQPSSTQTFCGSNIDASNNHVQIYVLSTGVLGAEYKDGGANSVHARTSSAVFADGVSSETKIKVTFSETNGIKLYIDDTEQTLDGSYPGTPGSVDFSTYANTTRNFFIGARNNAGTETELYSGKISDFKIRDNDNTIVVQYPFAEGYGNTFFDVSGNDYQATLNSNIQGVWSKWDLNSSPTATGTSTKGAGYTYTFAFDTDLTIDGAYLNNCWLSDDASVTNQRLVVDLGSSTVIRNVRISNSHDSGTNDDTGVKTTTIFVSDDASDYTGTFGTDNAQTQIWAGIVPKHTASDINEFFEIDLDEKEISGRYLIFEFDDNWGDATNMGLRRIEVNSERRSYTDSVHYNVGYGHNKNVATFNGSSEYIDTNQSFQSTFQNDFEFRAVIWPDDGQPASNQNIFGAVNADDSDEFTVFLNTSGQIQATFTANTNTATATGGITLANGAQTKPVTIKVVANSSTIQVFVNDVEGTAVSTAGITFSEYTSSDNPYIGAQNDNSSATGYFDGKIWNVELYDNTSSLDAQYPLGDGSGTAVIDTVGTNGTASAATIWGNVSYIKREKIPAILDQSTDIYGSASISDTYTFGNNRSESFVGIKNGIVNQYIITEESDFPLSDDGTKYVLETGTYLVNGTMTVSKTIDKHRDSGIVELKGASVGFCVINSTVSNLFDVPYLNQNFRIDGICLTAPSGTLFNINNPDIGGSFILTNVFVFNTDSLGTISNCSFNSDFAKYTGCDSGFVLTNNTSVIITDTSFSDWTNTASSKFIRFTGTTVGDIICSRNFFETTGSNESIFDFDSGLTTSGARIVNNSIDITDGGSIFAAGSKDQTDPYIIFINNSTAPNSKTNTLVNVGANTTDTTIVAANAITLATSDDWSNEYTERFTIDANGVAEYTGIEDETISIISPLAIEPASGTNKDLENRTVNIHGHTDYVVTFTNGTNTINETSTALSDGDTISFYNTAGTLPAELYEDIIYYVVNQATNSFQVSYTLGGAAVAFTDDGTPTNSYNTVEVLGITAASTIDAGSPSNITAVSLSDLVTGDQIAATVRNTTDAIDITINSGGLKITKS